MASSRCQRVRHSLKEEPDRRVAYATRRRLGSGENPSGAHVGRPTAIITPGCYSRSRTTPPCGSTRRHCVTARAELVRRRMGVVRHRHTAEPPRTWFFPRNFLLCGRHATRFRHFPGARVRRQITGACMFPAGPSLSLQAACLTLLANPATNHASAARAGPPWLAAGRRLRWPTSLHPSSGTAELPICDFISPLPQPTLAQNRSESVAIPREGWVAPPNHPEQRLCDETQ